MYDGWYSSDSHPCPYPSMWVSFQLRLTWTSPVVFSAGLKRSYAFFFHVVTSEKNCCIYIGLTHNQLTYLKNVFSSWRVLIAKCVGYLPSAQIFFGFKIQMHLSWYLLNALVHTLFIIGYGIMNKRKALVTGLWSSKYFLRDSKQVGLIISRHWWARRLLPLWDSSPEWIYSPWDTPKSHDQWLHPGSCISCTGCSWEKSYVWSFWRAGPPQLQLRSVNVEC